MTTGKLCESKTEQEEKGGGVFPLDRSLNIAVIGGGTRCAALLKLMEQDPLRNVPIKIVAVADHNPEAIGFKYAMEKGIYTTENFKELVNFPGVDSIIELTGNEELLEEVLPYLPARVRVQDYAVSRLLGEIVLLSQGSEACNIELDFTRNFISALWDSVEDQILLLDEDYKIIDINPAMLDVLKAKREDVIGRYCYQVMHHRLSPCNTTENPCPLQESLQTGRSARSIHKRTDQHNEVSYYEMITYPISQAGNDRLMVLEIIRDITSEFEEQMDAKTRHIKRNLARLVHEDKMIALGKLVASAVHEINNPISGIHALAKLMYTTFEQKDELTEEEKNEFKIFLGLISKESSRCGEIVSNLLSFSRQQKMEARQVNLNEVIETVLTLCKHKMSLQDIQLTQDFQEDLPEIKGDYHQIQQCLMNIIFNGIEAMSEGGAISISTKHEVDRNRVRVDICDTGCGIPEENISRIFEPFFSTKTEDKGVGLGLSVVYGIIREHCGSVYVDSKPGEGTCFVLRFPVISSEEKGSPKRFKRNHKRKKEIPGMRGVK